MDLVGYLRVSTRGQVDGWGLDRQRATITKFAAERGHQIVTWVKEPAVSGTVEALDRPGFRDAIRWIREGRAEGIAVANIDRLARDLMVQEAALGVVWRYGGTVVDQRGEVERSDPDDPSRNLIRQVLGAVAQFEKEHLVMRLRHGREAKADAGGHAVGRYPYGWRGNGTGRTRDRAPDAQEQVAVGRIVELRRGGMSYRKIAAQLDAEGLRPRHAATWSAMTVRAVALRACGQPERERLGGVA